MLTKRGCWLVDELESYRELQRVTESYRELQRVTRENIKKGRQQSDRDMEARRVWIRQFMSMDPQRVSYADSYYAGTTKITYTGTEENTQGDVCYITNQLSTIRLRKCK